MSNALLCIPKQDDGTRYMGPRAVGTEDWAKWVVWTNSGWPTRFVVQEQYVAQARLDLKKGKGRNTMRTITIELRFDYDNNTEKDAIIKEAMLEAARGLFTTANLISDKRKPQIAVHASDFFVGTQEIDIVDGTVKPTT